MIFMQGCRAANCTKATTHGCVTASRREPRAQQAGCWIRHCFHVPPHFKLKLFISLWFMHWALKTSKTELDPCVWEWGWSSVWILTKDFRLHSSEKLSKWKTVVGFSPRFHVSFFYVTDSFDFNILWKERNLWNAVMGLVGEWRERRLMWMMGACTLFWATCLS